MAKKDWLTGQPLERQGPNPIAGFLAGLMQAQAGKQQQEDAQRREQQKMAMMQIQEGRTLLEKAAQMDPALWGDERFITSWKTGDVAGLAGWWKPPATAKTYDDQNVGGNIVRLDPETGTYKTVYEGKPAAPEYKYVMLPWGNGQKQGRVGPNGYEVQDSKGQWVPFSGVTPGKPEKPSPNPNKKDPEELKRTDMDAVERWLFSGSYDPIKGIFSPGWLKVMGDQKKDWNTVKAGILNRFGDTPWLANYAIKRAQGDPTSPYYTGGGASQDTRKAIPKAQFDSMVAKANGDPALIAQIQAKYRPE